MSDSKQFVRAVEFEGVTYEVDVRRLKSREFLRRFMAVQRDTDSIVAAVDLLDYVFEGDLGDSVAATAEANVGYEDYEEIMRIEAGVLEAAGAKN